MNKSNNFELLYAMDLDVIDNNIWIETIGESVITVEYENNPKVEIFCIFNSRALVGFCIIPDEFSKSTDMILNFNVNRFTNSKNQKDLTIEIVDNDTKNMEDYLGDGSNNQFIEINGTLLISVEGHPWEEFKNISLGPNTFEILKDSESAKYLQINLKDGFYYLIGEKNSTNFFDRNIAFVLHEDYIISFFQSKSISTKQCKNSEEI
jgi:hypothetical protein